MNHINATSHCIFITGYSCSKKFFRMLKGFYYWCPMIVFHGIHHLACHLMIGDVALAAAPVIAEIAPDS